MKYRRGVFRWGDEKESKDGEGEMCVREGESKDESKSTVTYILVVLHVYIWGWRGGW